MEKDKKDKKDHHHDHVHDHQHGQKHHNHDRLRFEHDHNNSCCKDHRDKRNHHMHHHHDDHHHDHDHHKHHHDHCDFLKHRFPFDKCYGLFVGEKCKAPFSVSPFSFCIPNFRLNFAGLNGNLAFQLFRFKGCCVEIVFECAGKQETVEGKICNVGTDFVDVLKDDHTVVTILIQRICNINWPDEKCNPCAFCHGVLDPCEPCPHCGECRGNDADKEGKED